MTGAALVRAPRALAAAPSAGALAAALEALYALPADRPGGLGVCHCAVCMHPAFEARVLARPRRAITADEIAEWLRAVEADMTERAAFWMLPRLLELVVAGARPWPAEFDDAEARLLRALPATGFPDAWRPARVAAIGRVAGALVDAMCESLTPDLDAVLCMLNEGGIDVVPFFDRLRALPDDRLAALLAATWDCAEGARPAEIPMNPHWAREPGRTRARAFYAGEELALRMTRAALAGDRAAEAVSDVLAADARWRARARR